ncbi:carboxypeptidase regulatory-like domain-containing protein [Flavobacterium sp. 3HN19-14]|uniref:carboxypeptidase regulatory-like domain-containing protein n=1 Tax=Flavobacterium sp. 3HN19-14 TaxID=3448133 RepID=UPI003EE13027
MKNPQKYIITIDEPCHENWSDMQPQNGGRFCGSCVKSVIDFTKLSDSQIISILQKSNGASICGRFNKEQINKIMVQTNAERSNPALYKILAGLLLLASVETAVGQNTQTTNPTETAVENEYHNIKGKVAIALVISGTVTNQKGKAVAGASIFSQRTNTTILTDKNGQFSLKTYGGDQLTISKSGYETQNISVLKDVIKIVLKKTKIVAEIETRENGNTIMGDVAYVEVPRKVNYVIDGVLNADFKIDAIDAKRIKSVSVIKEAPSEVRSSRNDVETINITTDLTKEEKQKLKIKTE